MLEATPTLGGEDFSFFGHAGIPASFAFLGAGNDAIGAVHGLHTPQAWAPGGFPPATCVCNLGIIALGCLSFSWT